MNAVARGLIVLALVLSASDARSSDPLTTGIVNPDPQALEAGIVFDRSVPGDQRQDLVEGLRMIWNVGVLPRSEQLAQLLRPAGSSRTPATGPEIVTFFLQRARIILGQDACGKPRAVIINGDKTGFSVTPRPLPPTWFCRKTGELAHRLVGDTIQPGRTGFEIDGFVVPEYDVYDVPMSFFTDYDYVRLYAPPARSLMTATVGIHEAAHSDFGAHDQCPGPLFAAALPMPAIDRQGVFTAKGGFGMADVCNPQASPLLPVDTFLLRSLAFACNSCSFRDRLAMMHRAVSTGKPGTSEGD